MDTWLNELEQHARILKSARALLAESQRETSGVRSDLVEWKARASRLGDKVDEAERRLSEEHATKVRLSTELRTAGGRIQELQTTAAGLRDEVVTLKSERDQARAELETERQAHLATREELLHRMEVATEARLTEFRNRLAGDVTRVVSHVPPPGAELSPDMLRVIHLRLHEVLGALRSAGIGIPR